MTIKSKWTPFFLLLAAAALTVSPIAGSLSVITWDAAGVFLVLAFILVIRAKPGSGMTRPIWQFLLAAGLLLAAVSLFGFLHYRPALMAAPGYTLHNVTDPGWLNGRVKSLQAIAEQTPCTYTLSGWQVEDYLYYEAVCAGNSQVWRYSVSADQSEKVDTAPTNLYAETVPAAEIINGILADVYPRELTTISRETFIVGDVAPSPNGRFTALVSRHIYGPQDVLLLTPSP